MATGGGDPGPVAASERPQERTGARCPCSCSARAGDRPGSKETPARIGQGTKKPPPAWRGLFHFLYIRVNANRIYRGRYTTPNRIYSKIMRSPPNGG